MEKDKVNNILSIKNLSKLAPSIQVVPPELQAQLVQQFQRQQQQNFIPLTPAFPDSNDDANKKSVNKNSSHQANGHSSSRNSSLASKNGRASLDDKSDNENLKTDLIDLVTCKLCKGYLIDAATLDLCMHTFCRPCVVKFIREKPRCPECNLEIKEKRFLSRLKTDVAMQNIVYKLVPGLYEKEMARRRKFYAARPAPTPRHKNEMFGDIPPSKTIKPEDMLNISLTWLRDDPEDEPIKSYFLCRADSTMHVLKKLLIGKFGLERPIRIYYGNSEILCDLTALMDVAASYSWSPDSKVLDLGFREQGEINESPCTRITK